MKEMRTAAALAAILLPVAAMGQLALDNDSRKHDAIAVDRTTVQGPDRAGSAYLTVMSANGFSVSTPDAGAVPMFKAVKVSDNLVRLDFGFNYNSDTETGHLVLTAPDGTTKTVDVVRGPDRTAAADLVPYNTIKITKGQSTSAQSGEGIERSYDGNTGTLWHSSYGGGGFPITLTYYLQPNADGTGPHVDRVLYTPRQDGNVNGNFQEVEVKYSTVDAPTTYVSVATANFEGSSSQSIVTLPDGGIDNVARIRVIVKSGRNNFASCAEMEFQSFNKDVMDALSGNSVFSDALCTTLRPGVTPAEIDAIPVAFLRQLAMSIYTGTYRTDYRVASFEAYEPVGVLASRLKTNTYNQYENPTGIFFKAGETVPVFADGIPEGMNVKLIVHNWGNPEGESGTESSYALTNGINFVKPAHRGNGYVSYYTTEYATAPDIKLHFARGNVNGYFDAERGDDNALWQSLLANACSDILDIRCKRLQGAFPVARLKEHCPTDGVGLARNWDNLVMRERQILGMPDYVAEPKNRQFCRVVWSGFMFADGIGAAAHDGSVAEWLKPDAASFGWWGLAHELGHVNQVRPSLKWVGCGETTNNIYSAWVEFSEGVSHRLEGEKTGIDDYGWIKGGRFQAYFDQALRQGKPWQRQEGPDYFGSADESVTVASQDYTGKKGASVTVKTRNYDHFVKVCPFWQLQLYGTQCGFAPDVFGKTIAALQNASDANMSNGMQQLRFIKTVCDETGLNFLPFFEKAGMFKPVQIYVTDYGNDWIMISQEMCDELTAYVEQKGYPLPEGEVNYITALNWQCYKDRLPVTGPDQVGRGCTKSGTFVTVPHSQWQNAVAFETYDAAGNLLRITMAGLGSDDSNSKTQVLYPSGSAYIMAVGWDGTRIRCYGN